jgi:hypothetical protein
MGQPEGVIEICKYGDIRSSPCGLNNRERILVPYRLKKNRHSDKQIIESKKKQNKNKRQTGLRLCQRAFETLSMDLGAATLEFPTSSFSVP